MTAKYKNLILLLLTSISLWSQKLSDKLFTPIKLDNDSTIIVLEDFFPEIKRTAYRVTHVPEGLDLRVYNSYNFILYGKQKKQMDYIGISIHNSKYAIPTNKFNQNQINTLSETIKYYYVTSTKYSPISKILELKSEQKLSLLAIIGNKLIKPENIKTLYNDSFYTYEITIPAYVSRISRIDLRVFGYNDKHCSNDIYIPLSFGKPIENHRAMQRNDFHGNIIYAILVDKFKNGDTWNGGNLSGIKEKIIDEYFTFLGVNSLRLSPILKKHNIIHDIPNEQTKISDYHNHWHTASNEIEPKFGTNEDLKDLIGQAHYRDINIFMDYPIYYDHNEYSINKNNANQIKEFNLTDNYTYNSLSDSVLYWFKHFKIDGMIFQSINKIPDSFLRNLKLNLMNKISIPQNRALYQTIDNKNIATENIYSTKILDAKYDYNLFKNTLKAFLSDEYSMIDLKNKISNNFNLHGYHHLMGMITDGVYDDNETINTFDYQHKKDIEFQKIWQFLAFNLSMPGVPVIHNGNEIGIFGTDKKMVFTNLNQFQAQLKDKVSKLIKLRKSRMDLIYGDTHFLKTTNKHMVVIRHYLNQTSFILFNKSNQYKTIEIDAPKYIKYNNLFAEFGSEFMTENHKLICILPPYSFEIITSQ